MAEETKPEAAEAPAKKKPTKLIGMVAGLMIVQGAAVFMVARMTGPQAAAAAEAHLHGAPQDDHEKTVEIPLIEDKFQNMQTGRAWIWDVSIVLQVPAKNQEYVDKVLGERIGEVTEGVGQIFRRAQNTQLREPGLESLNRQIHAYVSGILGKDADGHDRFRRVLIVKCTGFPAE